MPTKTFDAFKVVSTNTKKTVALVWWDGQTIRSSSGQFLAGLKSQDIRGHDFGEGEKFFKLIPHRFSNGYIQCHETKVDQEGNEV